MRYDKMLLLLRNMFIKTLQLNLPMLFFYVFCKCFYFIFLSGYYFIISNVSNRHKKVQETQPQKEIVLKNI